MNPEIRQNLRFNWLDSIYHFASPQLQQLWVTGTDADVVVSYIECMCGYFDDLDMSSGLRAAQERSLLTADEVGAVAHFHALADSYSAPSENDEDVLRDPAWGQVVSAAQQAWSALRTLISDDAERARMEASEERWGHIPPTSGR